MLQRSQALAVSFCFENFLPTHHKHSWLNPGKMANFRAPSKIFFSTLQKAQYSSSSDKASQELVKQVQDVVENKVKSDKLIYLLPYLQHRKEEYIPSTRVLNNNPLDSGNIDKVKSNVQPAHLASQATIAESCNGRIVYCDTSESPKDVAESLLPLKVSQDQPRSLPVLMVADVKTPTMDLAHATVPLAFHLKDKKGLLVDAVVQDIKHVYFKTSSTLDSWYLVARQRGKTLYISVEEIMKRPNVLQDFLIDRINKDANFVYEPRLSAGAKNMDTGSIVEKLKQLIESTTTSIKNMLEKGSKPADEHKKGEKSQSKTEKLEKKTEDGEKK